MHVTSPPTIHRLSLCLFALLLVTGCHRPAEPSSSQSLGPTAQESPGPAASAPWIKADPNSVVVPEGMKWGTTTVSWDTGDGSSGQVFLAVKGQPEKLFGGLAPHGSQKADWIAKGGEYEFRLYADKETTKLLASVIVRGTR